ncbi:hypothetical protein [Sporomusa aerivorans]|uniref:hypothetical protein n=1 Tax=Sporomusa aerivorans TaxID=204936 RepID=UPI00352AAACB
MAVVKIGVKFCGNCNPHYDMPGLVTELAAQVDGLTFGRWDKGEYDILLVLNSCSIGCATRLLFGGRVIVVTSESVDHWPVTKEELPNVVLVALQDAVLSLGTQNCNRGG